MAVNDPSYRYATHTWEADGIRTEYEINFDGGFIRQEDVVAFSVAIDPVTGLPSDRQTHDVTFLTDAGFTPEDPTHRPATVEITPAIQDGRRVVIFRSTQKSSSMVDYVNGSILTKKNLDLANRQAILAIAEIMDGLNAAGTDITNQVQEVIDIQETIDIVYQQVQELLAAGGIVSVEPQYWYGVGETFPQTGDYPIPGATVVDAGFYDVYVGGNGMIPEVDYTIIVGDDPADSIVRFTPVLPGNITWLVVLRGYARPYTGPQPVTDLRMPVLSTGVAEYFVDFDSEYSLVTCTNVSGCDVQIKPIPPTGDRLGTGSYVAVRQSAAGQVTISPETGDVTVLTPAGYLPRTRGLGSIVYATCESGDDDRWVLSGDLAVDPEAISSGGPVVTVAVSSGTGTVDCYLASVFKVLLTSNTTLAVTHPNPADYTTDFELWITQDGTGGWTFTLPASFKAQGGSDTSINAGASRTTILKARTIDGGTTWAYVMQEVAA